HVRLDTTGQTHRVPLDRVQKLFESDVTKRKGRRKMGYLSPDEALRVERRSVRIGDRRMFFSTLQGAGGDGVLVRRYTGQEVTVVRDVSDTVDDESGERMFCVRAGDGVQFD